MEHLLRERSVFLVVHVNERHSLLIGACVGEDCFELYSAG